MNILILFASKEGQTEKIAGFIAEVIRHYGHQATTQLGKNLPKNFNPERFSAVIIGGSIHMGKYPGYLHKFVSSHRDWLNQVPTAFFTVCMAIHSANEKAQIATRALGDNFIAKYQWRPNLMETFAGAIRYTHYNFITRKIMQLISRKEGSNTDTSQDHEYTDWDAVSKFTEKFLHEVKEAVETK